jgi:hypothetical protein
MVLCEERRKVVRKVVRGGLAVCVRVAGRTCGDFFSRQEGRTYRPEGI